MKGNVFMYLEKQLEDVAAKIESKEGWVEDMRTAHRKAQEEMDELWEEMDRADDELKGLRELEVDLNELLY